MVRTMLRLGAVVVLLAASTGPVSAADAGTASAVVRTEAGDVRGIADGARRAFLGVPYAAPPVGALRWRAPEPARAWTGVRDATRPGSSCPQLGVPGAPGQVPSTDEDCLHLNVETPRAPGRDRPVLVFVHGGSGISGAGSLYPAATLAERTGTVVVTVNYRLGALGHLALPDLRAEAPALNYALQDQQAALRWVHRNIAAFGGDASRVTLAGESAGGQATCAHLTSPGSAGLFHRAVVMSGACDLSYLPAEPERAFAISGKYAADVGCPDGPGRLACLRAKPVADLLGTAPPAGDGPAAAIPGWPLVYDDAVVPGNPLDLLKKGRGARVPVMVGVTRDEGRMLTAVQFQAVTGRAVTEEEYQRLLTSAFGPLAFVLGGVYSSRGYGSPEKALAALYTDTLFACPAAKIAATLAPRTPTYAYRFSDRDAPNWYIPVTNVDLGAYHAGELPYLFDIPTERPFTASQRALSHRMMDHWASFAATGSPGGPAPWPRYDLLTTPYKDLLPGPGTEVLRLGAYQTSHNCLLWDVFGALGSLTG
ncbi:carboxylesterase/lipase family protein [Actinomadura flavalba]|uniref:carboxylesterase/lipase family protein n=1 Tax=Actinomadura flavalba TaxID=1120938 RepID=UPI0003647DC4|nr:carboxylesterase family protein [Actinomadura flavalba]